MGVQSGTRSRGRHRVSKGIGGMIVAAGGVLALIVLLVVTEIWTVNRSTKDLNERIRKFRRGEDGGEE